jgi:hypothetical protein
VSRENVEIVLSLMGSAGMDLIPLCVMTTCVPRPLRAPLRCSEVEQAIDLGERVITTFRIFGTRDRERTGACGQGGLDFDRPRLLRGFYASLLQQRLTGTTKAPHTAWETLITSGLSLRCCDWRG